MCLIVSLMATRALAQSPSSDKPKEFYREGFVTDGSDKPKQLNIESGSPQHQPGKQPEPRNSLNPFPMQSAIPTATPTPSNFKTYKVVALSAIISTMDAKHFDEVLGELKDVAVKYDFPVHNIWAPGDLKALESAQAKFLPIMARGATVSFGNVPKRYLATLSPTWIIETTEGEIVMEATGPLMENFNENGEFVDIPRKLIDVTPVPTPTPESAEGKLQELGEMAEGAGDSEVAPMPSP